MRSAQASSISESQCCRIKEFVDNNEIFSLGSTPSRVLIYSWIKEGILPCKRINEERVIHLSALKTCLEAQALQKGFQYELGKTTLVKLSLFPSLFPPSAIPCRRTVYNLEKKGASMCPEYREKSLCRRSRNGTAFETARSSIPLRYGSEMQIHPEAQDKGSL